MSLFTFVKTHYKNVCPHLSQFGLSLCITLYTTAILNVSVWQDQFTTIDTLFSAATLVLLLTFVCISAFTLLILYVFSLGGRWVYRILSSLFILCCSAAAYYMIFFNVVIGYGVVISLFTTELELSQESVGWKFTVWVIATGLIPAILIWLVKETATFYDTLRQKKTLFITGLRLIILVACIAFPLKQIKHLSEANEEHRQMPSAAGVIAHRYLPTNWIAGLGMVTYHFYAEAQANKHLFIPTDHFSYQLDPDRDDVTVIFVIGETTRSDHMHILGYERETTPMLEKQKNLIAFKGQSCDTATALSLRCMFVRPGGTSDDESRQLKELNVFASLKRLGFSSELFAMQGEAWFYNSTETDNYALREMVIAEKGNEGKPMDDMLLLTPLSGSLARHPKGKHLVVLHTKGSHHLYSQRYPRSFATFTPECLSIDNNCTLAQYINAFDNSVLYVDLFLSNVIQQVKDKKAIVFFSSDHGESIDEKHQFHATPLKIAPPEQRRVPIMVWMSDSFIHTKGGGKAFEAIKHRQQSGELLHHEEFFDSILGCVGYTSDNGGINPKNNWCQKQ